MCEPRRVTGRLSYRQAVASLHVISQSLAGDELASLRRWGRGFAVYVRHDEETQPKAG